jgi:predicted DNA-binding protein
MFEKKKSDLKSVSFRIDKDFYQEFRELCQKNNISQTGVIKDAIRKAIKEMKELES